MSSLDEKTVSVDITKLLEAYQGLDRALDDAIQSFLQILRREEDTTETARRWLRKYAPHHLRTPIEPQSD